MGTITDAKGNKVGEFADTLEDWKQAAEVEAGIRRELQAKLAAIEAGLKERGLFVFEHIDGTISINER